MDNRKKLINKIKKTEWYKLKQEATNLENYSEKGLQDTLEMTKQHTSKEDYIFCRKCHINLILKKHKVCQECYEKYITEKQTRVSMSRIRNLDKSLSHLNTSEDISDREYVYRKMKEREKRKVINLPREIWQNNFSKDFPDYNRYMNYLRHSKIEPTDIISIKLKIAELDEILKKYEQK